MMGNACTGVIDVIRGDGSRVFSIITIVALQARTLPGEPLPAMRLSGSVRNSPGFLGGCRVPQILSHRLPCVFVIRFSYTIEC